MIIFPPVFLSTKLRMNLTKELIVTIIRHQIPYRCLTCSMLRILILILREDHRDHRHNSIMVVHHLKNHSRISIQGLLGHRIPTTATIPPTLLHHMVTCWDQGRGLCHHLHTVTASCLVADILDRIRLQLVWILLVLFISVEVGGEGIIAEQVGTAVILGQHTYHQGHMVRESLKDLGSDIRKVVGQVCN